MAHHYVISYSIPLITLSESLVGPFQLCLVTDTVFIIFLVTVRIFLFEVCVFTVLLFAFTFLGPHKKDLVSNMMLAFGTTRLAIFPSTRRLAGLFLC